MRKQRTPTVTHSFQLKSTYAFFTDEYPNQDDKCRRRTQLEC